MGQDQHRGFASSLYSVRPSPFATELHSEGERIVVTARGQLDVGSQPLLALTLAKAIASGQYEVVIDLEGLDSIDPEDVGLLVRAKSLLQSRGQHLVVRSPCTNAEVLAACALLDPFASVGHVDESAIGTHSSVIG
jgi:anti-anti-sigma factor